MYARGLEGIDNADAVRCRGGDAETKIVGSAANVGECYNEEPAECGYEPLVAGNEGVAVVPDLLCEPCKQIAHDAEHGSCEGDLADVGKAY